MANYSITFRNKTVLIFLVILLLNGAVSAEERADKFLLMHVDGTSVDTLFEALENGTLPNLAAIFAEGQQSRYGVTVYPGKTPMVLSRLKKGLDNSEGIISWAYINREENRKVGVVETFFHMLSQVSPISRSQFALQYPGVNHLAGISLLNLERLWETHDIVEFYWLNSDTMGHLGGKEAQLKSLARLDHYLGLAKRRGALAGANFILYADHGATLDDIIIVHYQEAIGEVLGDELRFLYYPHIFLHKPEKKQELAQTLIEETALDLAAVQVERGRVLVFTAQGNFEIVSRDGEFQYLYQGEDYFGYSDLGYQGEFLSADEWLRLTKGHLYPATPVILAKLFEHPNAGDIVFSLAPPKIPYYHLGPKGHHASLQKNDLNVPLLLAGPAFAEMEEIQEFWLHELFSKHLTMVDFATSKKRERHSFSIVYPFGGELAMSPAHRLKGGLTFSEVNVIPWLEFDVYSSFLTRFWLGTEYNQGLAYRFRGEAFLGDFKVNFLKRQGVEGEFSFHWRPLEEVELMLGWKRAGVTVVF